MQLVEKPLSDYLSVVAEVLETDGPTLRSTDASRIYQRIHFQLIEARQRIKYLEKKI
jgi:hypothetical protein